MIAPLELSRNAKIVSGETAAAMTHKRPTTEDARIAVAGTPRRVTATSWAGASRRAARTNSMREAVYIPEFRQLSTAVNTTAFMMWSAYGIPISVNAETNGEAASFSPFHGRIVTSRNIEPTKKIAIRRITELAAFATALSGSEDSAAAIVAISAPTIEKITVTTPTVIAMTPSGKNPPWLHRLEKSIDLCGHKPRTKSEPSAMNTMIAATLIPANQNSNSPNDDTENRLVAVIKISSTNADNHSGMSTQYWMIFAPAIASKPTTITQKYQYNQPTEKPAQLPSALRA